MYLKLAATPSVLLDMASDPGYRGGNPKNPLWRYQTTDLGALQIVSVTSERHPAVSLPEVDCKSSKLIDLIARVVPDDIVAATFVNLFGRWMEHSPSIRGASISFREDTHAKDPLTQLAEFKLLLNMMERVPDKLAGQPNHLLDLASQVLTGPDGMGGDNFAVALSLVSVMINAPGFQKHKVDPNVMRSIESSIKIISQHTDEATSKTALHLAVLLGFRDEMEHPAQTSIASNDRYSEDRKTHDLAISYISDPDSPPPVRSEGIGLLLGLIKSDSPVIDVTGVLVLASSIISDKEDFVNLQSIKIFTLLADQHPKAVTRELVDEYVDAKEMASVDSRLRIGEALLQVIERLGETFNGEVAKHVGEALLAVAGRRGLRPKKARRQARDEKQRQMREKPTDDTLVEEVER